MNLVHALLNTLIPTQILYIVSWFGLQVCMCIVVDVGGWFVVSHCKYMASFFPVWCTDVTMFGSV